MQYHIRRIESKNSPIIVFLFEKKMTKSHILKIKYGIKSIIFQAIYF